MVKLLFTNAAAALGLPGFPIIGTASPSPLQIPHKIVSSPHLPQLGKGLYVPLQQIRAFLEQRVECGTTQH